MFRKVTLLLTALVWSAGSAILPQAAWSTTTLTRADIERLRNQVNLIPDGRSARPATLDDLMTPGDALSTAREAFAELRFNDGSLARVGELVLFQFVPNTRTFQLSNGTLLLLVPPGRGNTRIRTPNATAGVRGSALFVRYNQETDTTLVGALTTSGIEVGNSDLSQRQELKAGQLAVIVGDRIESVYEFDLTTFYETSELVRGLNLETTENLQGVRADLRDESMTQVRQETTDALQAQSPVTGPGIIENPSFVQLSPTPDAGPPELTPDTFDFATDGSSSNAVDILSNDRSIIDSVNTILEAGEIQAVPEPAIEPIEPPMAPPTVEPPTVEPPTVEPPTVEPPLVEPTPVEPPPVEPPPVAPPTVEPPPVDPTPVDPPPVDPLPVSPPPATPPNNDPVNVPNNPPSAPPSNPPANNPPPANPLEPDPTIQP
ncbi:MAG: FecR domain-containing protein [Elainellaceae cyanobacterium]